MTKKKTYAKTTQTNKTLCLSTKNKARGGKVKPREKLKNGMQRVCRGSTGLDYTNPIGQVKGSFIIIKALGAI